MDEYGVLLNSYHKSSYLQLQRDEVLTAYVLWVRAVIFLNVQ